MEHTEYVDLGRFETYIHYHFKDKNLLLEALSHSSYANEKRKTRKCNNLRRKSCGKENYTSDYGRRY